MLYLLLNVVTSDEILVSMSLLTMILHLCSGSGMRRSFSWVVSAAASLKYLGWVEVILSSRRPREFPNGPFEHLRIILKYVLCCRLNFAQTFPLFPSAKSSTFRPWVDKIIMTLHQRGLIYRLHMAIPARMGRICSLWDPKVESRETWFRVGNIPDIGRCLILRLIRQRTRSVVSDWLFKILDCWWNWRMIRFCLHRYSSSWSCEVRVKESRDEVAEELLGCRDGSTNLVSWLEGLFVGLKVPYDSDV